MKFHKTLLGNLFASLLAKFHTPGTHTTVTVEQIIHTVNTASEELAVSLTLVNEISAKVKDIHDPALLVPAIAEEVIRNQDKLPQSLLAHSDGLETTIINVCHTISGLPVSEIEGLVKEVLAKH
jgi:hypothetical protein